MARRGAFIFSRGKRSARFVNVGGFAVQDRMKRGSRRRFITVAGGLAVAAVLPATATAQMNRMPPNNMPEVIRRLVGTAKVNTGRVKLGVPPLVENGHLVPQTDTVESPMTEAEILRGLSEIADL